MIVIAVAGPTELVAGEEERNGLSPPTAVMVGGNASSAIYRPSFA